MATIDRVAVQIEGDASKLKRALSESSRASQQFATTTTASFARVSNSFKTILGIGGAFGFAALGTAAIRASDRVELGLRKIRIGTGRTREETEKLERVFDNVFTRVPQDAAEVGSAIESLNSVLGAQDELLERLSKKVLDASRLMGEDGANNALLFARGMNQFGESAERGEEVIDALFEVSTRTGIGFGELIGLTNEYGSVLKNANFTIEESAELFGRLSASGLSVSRVSPGLNAAFRNWAKEGKNARDELGRVIERMRSAKTETEALAIAADAFGAEGAQRLTVAARSGALELNNLAGAADNAGGAIERANKSSETFSEVFGRILNKLSTIGGQGLALQGLSLFDQILGQIIDKAKSFIRVFEEAGTVGSLEKQIASVTGLSVETVRAADDVQDLIDKFKELNRLSIVPPGLPILFEQLKAARGEAQGLGDDVDDLEDGFGSLVDLLGRGGGGGGRQLSKSEREQMRKQTEEGLIAFDTQQLEAILQIEEDIIRNRGRSRDILDELAQAERKASIESRVLGRNQDSLRASLDASRTALRQLIDEGFTEATPEVQELAQKIGGLELELSRFENTSRETDSVVRELGLTFTSAFEDAVLGMTEAKNAGEALRNVLQGLLQDIARLVLRKTVTEPLLNSLSAGLSSGAGGFSFQNFSSVLSGFPNLSAGTFRGTSAPLLSGSGAGALFPSVFNPSGGGGSILPNLLSGFTFGTAHEGAFAKRRGLVQVAEDEPEFIIPLSKVTSFFGGMLARMTARAGFSPSASSARAGGGGVQAISMGGIHFHGTNAGDFRRSELQIRSTIAQGVREGQRGL